MSHMTHVLAGGHRWRVDAALCEQLLGPVGLRLQQWLDQGQARIVKHGPHRTVYRVVTDHLDIHVKQDRPSGSWVPRWLRPGKASAEAWRAEELRRRGVPTIEPLASGDGFLVTRTLRDALPLAELLQSPLSAAERQQIAVALGQFLARMHDAGVVHHDLHPGNLLIRPGPCPQLYLIDLHAVRLGAPLSWRARRENLVVLNRWFILRSSRADRLRFCRSYLRHLQRGPVPGLELAAREVERRTLASNLAFWRTLDSRCRENNRRFRQVQGPGLRGHAVADLEAEFLNLLLQDPDYPFRLPNVKFLKDSRSSTVIDWEVEHAGQRQRLIYKRFAVTAWSDPLAALLRPPPALRCWQLGHGLRLRWLPTPRPLVVLHRLRHGLPCEGYLLTAKVENAEDLHALGQRLLTAPRAQARQELLAVLEIVARLIRDLHARQVSHRDLKSVNLLLVRPGTPSPLGLAREPVDHWPLLGSLAWLIDLVGVRLHRQLGRRRKVQNLARLNASFLGHPLVSRTDRLRFLRLYLNWGLFGRAGWKDWWREIAQATQAKVTRNERRGRVLY